MKIPLQCKTAREHPQKPHPHRSKAGSSQGSPQLEAREAGRDAVTAGYSLVAKGTNSSFRQQRVFHSFHCCRNGIFFQFSYFTSAL